MIRPIRLEAFSHRAHEPPRLGAVERAVVEVGGEVHYRPHGNRIVVAHAHRAPDRRRERMDPDLRRLLA